MDVIVSSWNHKEPLFLRVLQFYVQRNHTYLVLQQFLLMHTADIAFALSQIWQQTY